MVVTEFHRGINIPGTCNTLFQHPHRFESKYNTESTGSKAWYVFHYDRFFSHSPAHIRHGLYGSVSGFFSNNSLDETHEVNRIEKVHSNYVFRAPRTARY